MSKDKGRQNTNRFTEFEVNSFSPSSNQAALLSKIKSQDQPSNPLGSSLFAGSLFGTHDQSNRTLLGDTTSSSSNVLFVKLEDDKIKKSNVQSAKEHESKESKNFLNESEANKKSYQYCMDCNKLISSMDKLDHSPFHKIESISNIAMETIENLKTRQMKMKTEINRAKTAEKLFEDYTSDFKKVNEVKSFLKQRFEQIIDEIFEAKLWNRAKTLMSKITLICNEAENCKEKSKNIEEEIKNVNKFLHESYSYEEISDLYKSLPYESDPSIDFSGLTRIKEELDSLEIKKKAKSIEESIESALNFDMQCIVCRRSTIDDMLEGKRNFSNKMCTECEESIHEIKWTNGTRIFKGSEETWSTCCTERLLPPYFKCRIKILEANKGEKHIGLASKKCDSDDGCFDKAKNWWTFSNTKGICKDGKTMGETEITYGNKGDIVTVIYDKSKELVFEVNGINVKKSFGLFKKSFWIEGPFYLACADNSGTQYKLLEITPL